MPIPETEEEYDNLTHEQRAELHQQWEEEYEFEKKMKHRPINE